MEPSLFSFKTYTVTLTAPPSLSSQNISMNFAYRGVTKVNLNFNNLFSFSSQPFKYAVTWPGQPTLYINSVVANNVFAIPNFTAATAASALSYNVLESPSIAPINLPANVKVYFNNGVTLNYTLNFKVYSYNSIDLDLDILDVQNSIQPFTTIYNLQSNSQNVVFNITDKQN